MALTKQDIAGLYIALFNRAPEKDGLEYWYNEAQSGKSLSEIADAMISAAKQFPDVYPQYANLDVNNSESVKNVIEVIYQTLFDKDYNVDPEGIDYWVDEVVNKGKDLGEVVVTLENAAKEYLNSDDELAKKAAETFMNRVEGAVMIADTIPTADIDGDGKIDENDFTVFKSLISEIQDSTDTLVSALTKAKDYSPINFDLSSNEDILIGTNAHNEFNSIVSDNNETLNNNDKIDGKDGIDVMNVDMESDFNGFDEGYMINIEKLNLKNDTDTDKIFDLTGVDDIQQILINGSNNGNTINLNDLNNKNIEIDFNNISSDSDINFDANLDLSSDTDSMKLVLNNIGKTDTNEYDNVDDTIFTKINMNGIENVELVSNGLVNYIDLSGLGDATHLNISGDSNLNIRNIDTNIIGIDSRNLNADIDMDMTNIVDGNIESILTGKGNDEVSLNITSIKTNANIDGGDGNDILNLNIDTDATVQPLMNNFETLNINQLNGNLTYSALDTNGLKEIKLNISNLTDGKNIDVVNLKNDISLILTNESNNIVDNSATNNKITLDADGNVFINVIDNNATIDNKAIDNTNVELKNATNVNLNISKYVVESGDYDIDEATSILINVEDGAELRSNLVAPNITDAIITNKGTIELGGDSDISKLKSFKIDVDENGVVDLNTNNISLPSLTELIINGSGSVKLFDIGVDPDGNITNEKINIIADGLDNGFVVNNIKSNQDVDIDLTNLNGDTVMNDIYGLNVNIDGGKLGDITINDIDSFGNGTLKLDYSESNGNLNINSIGKNEQFSNVSINVSKNSGIIDIGEIDADSIDIDSYNTLNDVTINKIGNNSFSSKLVTLNFENSIGNNIIGDNVNGTIDVYVKDEFDYKAGLKATNQASSIEIGIDNYGNEFKSNLNGGIDDDKIDFKILNDDNCYISLFGNLGDGTDIVTIDVTNIISNSNKATIDLSGLIYDKSIIKSGSGDDVITLGNGVDDIQFGSNNGLDKIQGLNLGDNLSSIDKLDFSNAGMVFASPDSVTISKDTDAYNSDTEILIVTDVQNTLSDVDTIVENWADVADATGKDLVVLWEDSDNEWHVSKAIGGAGSDATTDDNDEYTLIDVAKIGNIDINDVDSSDFIL